MGTTVESLDVAWKQWCDFAKDRSVYLGPYDQQRLASIEAYQAIHQRFLAFSGQHPDKPEHLHRVIVSLSKGTQLVKAAVAWEHASAGPTATLSQKLMSRARGEQWRLVMAHGGLETVIKALLCLCHRTKGPNAEETAAFAERCTPLPTYAPLAAPNPHRADLARWLETGAPNGEHPIIDFLKMQAGDSAFKCWAVKGQSVDSWQAAIELAKALRHATAHGALSANKVCKWGLQDACETLSINLGEITARALSRLVEEPSAVQPLDA